MVIISELPELVIAGILKHVVEDVEKVDDIANNLICLAICRQWRYLALPLVHEKLMIEYTGHWDYNRSIEIPKVSSNINLTTSGNWRRMVKKLHIKWQANSFIDTLELLINEIGMDRITWPKNINDHLVVGSINDLDAYNPHKLDNGMLEKMSDIICNFRTEFPNISSMVLCFTGNCGDTTQFTSKLVETYSDRLKKLVHNTYAPLDLPFFPPNLTSLIYKCQPMPYLFMPKINTLPLKELKLSSLPGDYIWQQNCSSVVFPNLKKLDVSYLVSYYQNIRDEFSESLDTYLDKSNEQQQPLELPAVKYLRVNYNNNQKACFNVKRINPNLDKIIFDGGIDKLECISKSSIRSIRDVSIVLRGNVKNTDQLYRTTNKLLGKGIKNILTAKLDLDISNVNIDFRLIDWINLSKISFALVKSSTLLKVISKMPKLKGIHIAFLKYVEDDDTNWDLIENVNVKSIVISYCEYEGNINKPAEFILKLCDSIGCLETVKVPEELYKGFVKKLEAEGLEHKHLQEI